MNRSPRSSRNQLRAVFAVLAVTLGLTVAGLFWARAKVRAMNGGGGGGGSQPATAPSPSPAGATP